MYGYFNVDDPPCVGDFRYEANARKGYCNNGGTYYYEFEITDITYDGTSGVTPECNREDLIQIVQKLLLKRSVGVFDSLPDPRLTSQTYPVVYFRIPLCWQYFPVPNPQAGWKMCPVTDYCCIAYRMFYYYKQNEIHISILNQVAVGYSPPPDFTCLSDSITYTDCTKYECDSLALGPQQITPTQFLGADYLVDPEKVIFQNFRQN